ncbi:MAG: hypothetical protein DRP85_07345 [Candidatus Makaraimicrobium thalassicum]|nr:MAG: hypothetical protein DRP85_07345 [Candidatus Omnitrophota bacterium]
MVKMNYVPELTDEQVKDNHKLFEERASIYKSKGLDSAESREFILEKARPIRGRILEIGAGTGHMTLALASEGYKFTAIDSDREALRTTALNLAYKNVLSSVEFYVMDGTSLDFARGSFNNVVIVNVFHHVSDAGELLSEADRVIGGRGKLILADFNENGMLIVDSVHRHEGRVHETSGAGKEEVYSFLRSAGYEIKDYKDECHWILIAEK